MAWLQHVKVFDATSDWPCSLVYRTLQIYIALHYHWLRVCHWHPGFPGSLLAGDWYHYYMWCRISWCICDRTWRSGSTMSHFAISCNSPRMSTAIPGFQFSVQAVSSDIVEPSSYIGQHTSRFLFTGLFSVSTCYLSSCLGSYTLSNCSATDSISLTGSSNTQCICPPFTVSMSTSDSALGTWPYGTWTLSLMSASPAY